MLKYLLIISTVLIFGLFSGFVHSDEVELSAETLNLEGDPEYGEYLASDCKTCHKVKGSSSGVPLISGVPRKELIIALHAYKQKIRKNPVMQMMANRLSNEDIAALAIYFEGLK